MRENYIDDVTKYPALIAVNNILNTLNKSQQRYIRSFLGDFKLSIKDLKLMYNLTSKKDLNDYLVKLVREDYIKRIEINSKYDNNLKHHIKNYIFAKTRELIKAK